jgi:glycosyltransferase involved in cell wall biosynthesis
MYGSLSLLDTEEMRAISIVFTISSHLRYGGLEMVTAIKAEALASRKDCQVWIVNSEKLDKLSIRGDSGVKAIDLGIHYDSIACRYPFNLIVRFMKMLKHRRILKATLRRIQPDIVVSSGEEKFFLPFFKGPWKTIRECHYPKNVRQLFTSGNSRLNCISKLGDWFEYDVICRKFDRVVALTQEDVETNWKGRKNVCAIPNPTRFQPEIPSRLSEKRVLAIGRLSPEKNFASLVRAYTHVAKCFPDWRLDIYGEGPESVSLLSEIERRGLSDAIHLKGNSPDVEKEMLSSSLLVASSRYEGFSLVIVEALSCGLPVVSYSCPYGPSAIITEGDNGFLVPVDDEKMLAERICQLIADEKLRQRMGAAAFEHAQKYSKDAVLQEWLSLFNELLLEKGTH